jgi:NDP-sugar pyrophosphorylase family protein
MVVTFYTVCGLGPGAKTVRLDDRITDDKFCIAFNVDGKSDADVSSLKGFFKSTGAAEVNSKLV